MRLHEDNTIWDNSAWRSSTHSYSSIDVCNFRAYCLAANSSRPFKHTEPEPEPHTSTVDEVEILPRPDPVRPSVRPADEVEILPMTDSVRPSTSRGNASCSFTGTKPKRRMPKLSQPSKKSKFSRPPVRNSSPPDNSLGPELVLEVLDEERFQDSDVEVLSRSSGSSDQVLVIPSPHLQAQRHL